MAKIVIMTSGHLRHRFFVNALINYHEVLGVISESKPTTPYGPGVDNDPIVAAHFKELREKEEVYFGEKNRKFNIKDSSICSVSFNQSNTIEIFEWVRSFSPDMVVLFGTSIIKDPLLNFYKGRIINLHLGLSPYYRGSGTNFWPLVNRQPQCVGATIHEAVLKVDQGDIFTQVRPDVLPADRCHDFGCKTIIKAAQAMAKTISLLEDKKIKSVKQIDKGRLYKMNDFTAKAVDIMLKNFENGMVTEYIGNKAEYDKQFPIIAQ